MRYSALTERIRLRGGDTWSVHNTGLRRREAGEDIIFLTIGDPDQDPPAAVIGAAVKSLLAHRTGYTPIIGYPAVRQAIAARVARRSGQPCKMENVVVAPGTQAGLYCALHCLAGPGDEVIIPEPIYATYHGIIGASGATMVNVALRPERGFRPDLGALAGAITPRTRVIWINSPHNPTGVVFTRDEIEAIAALCREHDLWLLADEVYEDLAFARPHISAWSLSGMAGRTVVVSSLSKSHAIPGFRFGWVVGPPPLAGHLFNLLVSLFYGGPAFIQDGALAALQDELPEVAVLREDYRRRAELMTGLLREAPRCRVVPPEGGMFVLLDVRGTGLAAIDFARQLLEQKAVAVLPCDAFGPGVAGHLRIALSTPDKRLREAGERIVRFARALAGEPRPG